MHKRILVPMDDSALAQAGLPYAQSLSIASRIADGSEAETWTHLIRAEYKCKPISFLIRENSLAAVNPAVADAMKSIGS